MAYPRWHSWAAGGSGDIRHRLGQRAATADRLMAYIGAGARLSCAWDHLAAAAETVSRLDGNRQLEILI